MKGNIWYMKFSSISYDKKLQYIFTIHTRCMMSDQQDVRNFSLKFYLNFEKNFGSVYDKNLVRYVTL